MSDSWDKVNIICDSHDSKPDCKGCGYNTVKSGFLWELGHRFPCANAKGGQCKLVRKGGENVRIPEK